MSRYRSLCGILVSAVCVSSGPVLASPSETPMAQTAMQEALGLAATQAARGLLDALPPGLSIKTIAVMEFEGDTDGRARHAFEEAVVQESLPYGVSLVVPNPTLGNETENRDWQAITQEWSSSTRDDITAPDEVPLELLRTAMVVQGGLTGLSMNDTGFKAEATIEVTGLVCKTRQKIPASGRGEAWVPGGETLLSYVRVWIEQPVFWIVIGSIAVVFIAGCVGVVPVLRKVILAGKPRRIKR